MGNPEGIGVAHRFEKHQAYKNTRQNEPQQQYESRKPPDAQEPQEPGRIERPAALSHQIVVPSPSGCPIKSFSQFLGNSAEIAKPVLFLKFCCGSCALSAFPVCPETDGEFIFFSRVYVVCISKNAVGRNFYPHGIHRGAFISCSAQYCV